MMQERSYVERLDPRLLIYPSRRADQVKCRLLRSTRDPTAAVAAVAEIGRTLLDQVRHRGAASASRSPTVPILVLRGGLILWEPFRSVYGDGPAGILAPVRAAHHDAPTIAYGSVPRIESAHYVILDVLVASGRTMSACLGSLLARLSVTPPPPTVSVVAPFVSNRGRELILDRFDAVDIHCIWHNEQIDGTGRMVGPGFDVGQYALGGHTGDYLRWGGG